MAGLIRAGLSTTFLVVLYYLLPMTGKMDASAVVGLAVGLLVLVLILAFQLRSISTAKYPSLRAIEAVATGLPFLLILFASTYVLMNQAQPGSFSQAFDRTGALYFTITVFSTVGFGDIVPKTDPTRIATMIQMLVDLVLLGVVARLIVSAVQRGHERQAAQDRSP